MAYDKGAWLYRVSAVGHTAMHAITVLAGDNASFFAVNEVWHAT